MNGATMTATIKPIETTYRGYRFRSRLEARWAVFFDALGLAWEYEPQGYELPSGARYLPDFWLPGVQLHVEVKGTEEALSADQARYADAVLTGALPGNGLMFLGPIPDPADGSPQHFVLTTEKHCCGTDVLCLHIADANWLVAAERDPEVRELMPCTDLQCHWVDRFPPLKSWGHGRATYLNCVPLPPDWPVSAESGAAYRAARSARFEHGESGAKASRPTPSLALEVEPPDPYHRVRPLLDTLGMDFGDAMDDILSRFDLTDVERRQAAIAAVVPLIVVIENEHFREVWADELAAKVSYIPFHMRHLVRQVRAARLARPALSAALHAISMTAAPIT